MYDAVIQDVIITPIGRGSVVIGGNRRSFFRAI
jgi:hypothetical protein